jgi:tRNA threonylcarbamoyl adenosine modification protein YeaZ
MKTLAFDTCLDKTYITLNDGNKIIKSEIIFSDGENYHSAYLISTIVKVLKEAKLEPKDLDMIVTDIGPGSFTGIRACVTVARVLAQQLNIKAVGVSSLEILSNILGDNDMVALDARKNKAYVFDGEIKGAIDLEEVDKLVKGRRVITDNSLKSRLSQFADTTISYQEGNYPLGDILSKLGMKKNETEWAKLKPLYIQPPPVFGK